MTGSDRPEPIDPADDSWPQEDPDLTRVVPMGTPTGPAATGSAAGVTGSGSPTAGADSAGETAAGAEDSAQAAIPGAASDAGTAGASTGSGWSNAGTVASSWAATEPPSSSPAASSGPASPAPVATPPTEAYTPEPTTILSPPPGPGTGAYSTGPTSTGGYGYAATGAAVGAGAAAAATQDYQGGFGSSPGYQQPYGAPSTPSGAAPQVILPPATNVILPPTKIPQAESRVGINAIGTILGILLVFGGLILILRFGDFRSQTSSGDLRMDYLKFTWFVLGAVLAALPTFLVTWASWTALVPGIIVTGATVWAMVTPSGTGGAYYIDKATGWAFGDLTLGQFAAAGYGLLVGLPLLLTGLAAVFLRAGVRRTIVRQVASLQQP